MKSLAEHLGAIDPRPEDKRPDNDFDDLIDITDPKMFCQKLVASREFRQFLLSGIVLGDLPPAVLTRIIDHAWGKPVEKIEVKNTSSADDLSVEELKARAAHLMRVIDALEDDPPPTIIKHDNESRQVH